MKVINVLGVLVFTDDLYMFKDKYTNQINLNNQARGVYLIEVKTNGGIFRQKLILK